MRKVQSKVIEKPYGKIFYDKSNPLSYDSNHAMIREDSDYEFVCNDIANFYRSQDLTPRVYTFTRNKNAVGQYLEINGFEKSTEGICFFVQRNKRIIDIPKTLDIKRIEQGMLLVEINGLELLLR